MGEQGLGELTGRHNLLRCGEQVIVVSHGRQHPEGKQYIEKDAFS